MARLLIKGGRVIDPGNKINQKLNVLIENGKIIGLKAQDTRHKAQVIDAIDKIVVPGLIDLHAHLREPGNEDEETIASGTRAAAAGGITSVVCMANTNPVIDTQSDVEFIRLKAQNEGVVNAFPVGAVTKGLKGEELSEIGELKDAGVVGISDDGNSIMNSQVMRRALQYSKMFNLPVIDHCEDTNLSRRGVMNSGYIATILGLAGIPREAEEIMLARDITLAQLTKGILHIAHLSTAGSVELVRKAKKKGIKITADTCPHYFTLTEENLTSFNTNLKMYPPLRSKKDVEAIKKGLADGTIDCIATDHAPHLVTEKLREFNLAPRGIIGLETMLPLIITELVNKKVLSLSRAIELVTVNPARILHLDKGTLSPGADADVTIIDLKATRTITDKFVSKSKNSPFIGWTLQGFPVTTIVAGKVVFSATPKNNPGDRA